MPQMPGIILQVTAIETVTYLATAASLILAVTAIWLSIVFYKMSMAASNSTTEAAKGIASSVERLEKLFDKLYSDTFSMMKDTVSDMRKHIWPTDESESEHNNAIEEAEKRADEKINELKKSYERQISEALQGQKIAEDKASALRAEMRHLMERAITSSRQAESEAREETAREHILRQLRVLSRRQSKVTLRELVDRLGFPPHRVLHELERMRAEEIISLGSDKMEPETEVRLLRLGGKKSEG